MEPKEPQQPQQPPTAPPPAWTQFHSGPRSSIAELLTQQHGWVDRSDKVLTTLSLPTLSKMANAFNLSPLVFAGCALLSIIVICSLCGLTSIIANNAAQAQQQALAVAATQTAAAPTVTPAPTATLAPPTPTPTPIQQLKQIVDATANGNTYEVTVIYRANVVIVNETVWAGATVTALDCKQEIFNVQRVIWQQWASIGQPHEVNVNIIGPVQDKYGRVSHGTYAHSTILAISARLYIWQNLDADSAWDAYDEAFIRSDL